ncbi:MAG TPA: Trp biosynthesis-associated membrane protein [Mycobacteriales bacterium]
MTAARAARWELLLALACCAAGAGLVLLGGGREWVDVTVSRPSPLPSIVVAASGNTVEPAVTALGLVGLAGVVGLLATRRAGRLVLGGLLALVGLAVLVRALPHLAAPSRQGALDLVAAQGRTVGVLSDAPVSAVAHPIWPVLTALGGLGLVAAGVLSLWRGRRWPGMSSRYDAPAGRSPAPADAATGVRSDAELWDALDNGRDPTEA